MAQAVGCGNNGLPRSLLANRGWPAAVFPRAKPAPARLFRRVIRCRTESGCQTCRRLSDVGRASQGGEPPKQVAEKIKQVRKLADAEGRTVRFGIRLHVIVRETDGEAWEEAERLLKDVDDETIAKAQKVFSRFDSEGQRRMVALHREDWNSLEVSPNLWAGIGLVRGGAGTVLVGSPESVAERILEYTELGIETFILSGYPHLEEAYRTAELLFPHLPLEKVTVREVNLSWGHFGEIVANDHPPERKEIVG